MRRFQSKPAQIPKGDCLRIAQGIAELLHSGLSLASTLSIATELVFSQQVKASLAEQCQRILNGDTWSDALQNGAYRWPDELIAWVEVGENTGELAKCLKHYCDWSSAHQSFRKSLFQSMTYPLILLFVSICAAVFIHTTFSDLRSEETITNSTSIGLTLEDYAIAIGIGLLSIAGAIRLSKARPAKNKTHRFSVSIWSIQACNRLANTFQSLAFMLACGIPLLEAIASMRERFIHTWKGSPWIGNQLACLHSDIESGYPLMRSMELLRWPSFALSLAAIAEQTGDLPNLFEQLARIYYQQAEIRQMHILRWTGPLTLCLSAALLISSYMYSIWPLYAGMNEMVQ